MVNFNQFLKQAQSMQKKVEEMQEQMASKEYHGKAGGGVVNVFLTGRGLLSKIEIDPSLLKPDEKEILEDLILAAFNDAKHKADKDSQESMTSAFGHLGLPPGMKLPF